MGPSDLIKPVIERRFEGTIYFGRVSMRPGKPTTFASIPLPDKESVGNLKATASFCLRSLGTRRRWSRFMFWWCLRLGGWSVAGGEVSR